MRKRVPLWSHWGPPTPPAGGPERPLPPPAATAKPSWRGHLRVIVPIVPMLIGLVVAGVRGHLPEAAAAGMVVLGIGLLISTAMRNQFNAAQAALNAAFLPAVMLSGFIYEISSMPAPLRALTLLMPARYFVSCMQTMFQAGTLWVLLWREILMLSATAALFLGLTAKLTRRTME